MDRRKFTGFRFGWPAVVVAPPRVQPIRAPSDSFVVETFRDVGTCPEQQVNMVGHDRKTEDINSEDRGQLLHALLEPSFSVVEIAAGVAISSAEKRASHAARNAMVDANIGLVDDLFSGVGGHGANLWTCDQY